MRSTWSVDAALAETEPAAVPAPVPCRATTVTRIPCITPLVVKVLLAQRRFALVESCTIATQWSDLEVRSACSTSSCGVVTVMGVRPPAQLPVSAVVFRTFTSRDRAAGQPCDTDATRPGCALPQV